MDTAGNFTSSEETRDNVALVVQNLSFSVDSQTAHCVVDSRSNHNCVVRSFGQRTRHIGTAELSVFLVSLELGVVSQSGFQVVSVDAEFLSEFFRCLAFSNETLLDVCFDGFQALANAVIEEEVADFVSLLQFGSRNDVTSLEFVDEAFAFFVDEDSAVAANSFSDHFAVAGDNCRVSLNLFHVNSSSTDLFSHDDTVTGCAGLVSCSKAFQFRIDLSDHGLVGRETAGSDNNSFSVDDLSRFLALFELNADNLAVFNDQLLSVSHRTDVDVAVFGSLVESSNNFSTDEAAACRTVGAFLGSTGHHADVVQVTAEVVNEVDRILGVVSEFVVKVGVVEIVAALDRVVEVRLDGIFDSEFSLGLCFGCVQTASCTVCVAADHSHFFKNDNFFAEVMGCNSSREACTAGADNDDVGLFSCNCRHCKSSGD